MKASSRLATSTRSERLVGVGARRAFHHGLPAKLRLKPPSKSDGAWQAQLRWQLWRVAPTLASWSSAVARREHGCRASSTDVVFPKEYHHRPSRQGGSDDAQHPRHYPSTRLARSPLHRSRLSARLYAQAPDVRRPVLLPARPSRLSRAVAGVAQTAPRPLCRGGRSSLRATQRLEVVPFERGESKDERVAHRPRAIHRP